tara:strand:- start:485 stop:736 length:252 start_codon:yes stop_codon:yes gene_type:complete
MADSSDVSRRRLQAALLVLDHNPDAVDAVIGGMVSLDAAHRTAQERKSAAEDRDERIESMKRLFADLADKVAAEEMSLEEALA